MWKFNWLNFLILVALAHMGLFFILNQGSGLQILVTFLIFGFECIFSTVIYHRLLSHRSWKTTRSIEVIGTFIGIFTFTGTPITRTLAHRYHHKYTDTVDDPHSPTVVGIFRTYFPMLQKNRKMDLRLVEDLIKDRFHRWCHVHYFHVIVAILTISFLILGWAWTLTLFVAPGALCWMNVSICNIFCHLGKESPIVNSRLLSILTFGEGWHKNHHDNPTAANFGGDKFDIGFWLIKKLEKP